MLRPRLTFFDRFSMTKSWNPTRLIDLRNVCGFLHVFVFGGILFGGWVLAAPPNPPVFLGDDVIIAENNANRINAILDGYTVPSILSGLQYPADPVTTTTHEVRTNAELAAAIGGDGRLIRIYGPLNGGQANYAQFSLNNRTDIDIVMDNDATITGGAGWAWFLPVRRLRWTGGNINITSGGSTGFRISDAEDVLFDDVRMYKGGTNGHIFYPGTVRTLRFGIINSTLEFTANGPGTEYAIFSAAARPLTGNRGDWIFLNNRFIGQGPPARLMHMGLRTVMVGNYFADFPNAGNPASIRVHYDCDKFWFADNVYVSGGGNQPNIGFIVSGEGGGEDTDAIMNDFRLENNRYFATQSDFNAGVVIRVGDMVAANRSQATNWVFLNNIWSDPTGPAGGETYGTVLIDVPYVREGDLRVGPGHPSYETAPPASDFGATR